MSILLVHDVMPTPKSGVDKMLDTLLRAAGVSRTVCTERAVFAGAPNSGNVMDYFGPKKTATPNTPAFRSNKWLTQAGADARGAVLVNEGEAAILALGPIACWVLTGHSDLVRRRGAWHENNVIPTFSPEQVLRQYLWFPLVASDFAKAAELARQEGVRQEPNWTLIARPNIQRVRDECQRMLQAQAPIVFDIETSPKFRAITAIGLGSEDRFMCIPFLDEEGRGTSYWENGADELEAVRLIKEVLETPGILKIAHHATYDTTWLWSIFGIKVAGPLMDTRIMHHSLSAELPHTLGSIAHTFALLPPWKAQHAESKETD